MDRDTITSGLAVGVAVALAAGLGFIGLGETLLTTLGVLLVIVGLVGLMPVVRLSLARQSG